MAKEFPVGFVLGFSLQQAANMNKGSKINLDEKTRMIFINDSV